MWGLPAPNQTMSKRYFSMKTLLVTIVAMLLCAPAFAASENAAVVLKDADHPVGCFYGGFGFPLFTEDEIHTVATKNGNVKLICHFDVPEGFEPAKTMKNSGFGCGIYLPDGSTFTDDTRAMMNPGGRAKLTCTIHPDD